MIKAVLLCLMISLVVVGCKKSQSAETAPAQASQDASTPAPAPAPGNPANQAGAQPPAPTVDTSKAITDVNAALKTKDYQKAADTLIAIQKMPQLTEQQSAAIRGQMVELQKAVAGGLANGDPNAKAAADRLRAQASGSH